MTPVRLEPEAPRSRDKHSTTEPLRSPFNEDQICLRILAIKENVGLYIEMDSYSSDVTRFKVLSNNILYVPIIYISVVFTLGTKKGMVTYKKKGTLSAR